MDVKLLWPLPPHLPSAPRLTSPPRGPPRREVPRQRQQARPPPYLHIPIVVTHLYGIGRIGLCLEILVFSSLTDFSLLGASSTRGGTSGTTAVSSTFPAHAVRFQTDKKKLSGSFETTVDATDRRRALLQTCILSYLALGRRKKKKKNNNYNNNLKKWQELACDGQQACPPPHLHMLTPVTRNTTSQKVACQG
jgi:hypothetical protein